MADNNQPVPSLGDELVPPPSKKTKYKSKFHTKYRPSIQNNTVCALLTCKINSKVPCPQTYIPNKLAKQVKTATMRRNSYLRNILQYDAFLCF